MSYYVIHFLFEKHEISKFARDVFFQRTLYVKRYGIVDDAEDNNDVLKNEITKTWKISFNGFKEN